MATKGWTCRNPKCRKWHANRHLRKCPVCGRKRPKKRVPAHKQVLQELDYDAFVELNGGDFCWIGRRLSKPCGEDRDPANRRLDRDHDHKTGKARGLLCHWHNRFTVGGDRVTAEEHLAAYEYLTQT